eukprot:TRINITY_DN854_c0_g1_i1.p1 TRINITY_DN854_c0_g1~~TRINITY_DN854_c0_g1_i1.p1  ORF type:complete len:102 (-),score=25.40 TRINITY_DN854_c0_g1_i1:141-446(-)
MSHTIVLVQHENNKSTRTYFDYNSLNDALAGICQLFEAKLKNENPNARNITYDIKDLFQYIDHLPDLGVLVFSKQKGAYTPYGKSWVKTKVTDYLKSMASQ